MSLSREQLAQFQRDGYLLVPSFVDRSVVELCLETCRSDTRLEQGFAIWNYPEDGIYGRIARLRRLVEAMSQVLDGEVYHYQSKIMSKTAANRGVFEWHQDYGYWYRFALLYPLLASCMISLNGSRRENGCLQVLRGSHALGRVRHLERAGGKLEADEERVAEARKRHELVHVEMEPGDALFFHCNLLHSSDPNPSGRPRWTLITCYNARRNDPYKPYRETYHPTYSPVEPVSDEELSDWIAASALREAG